VLSIIIPNHNEPNIEKVTVILRESYPEAQIIIVDDPSGNGKGWAVRTGLGNTAGESVVFLDADMDIHPKMIKRLLPFLEDYDIVVGAKQINKGLLQRKILTFLSRLYIRVLFGLAIDTQTGIKVFRRKAIPDWKTDGYGFDIEVLYKARKLGFSMIEVPIDAAISKRMSWKSILGTLKESLRIRFLL